MSLTKLPERTWKYSESSVQTAYYVSFYSRCSRMRVGAVAFQDDQPISAGFNAPATPDWSNDCEDNDCELDNGHCIRTVHAEDELIANAAMLGVSLRGSDVYLTHRPCLSCLKHLMVAGVGRVFYIFYGDRPHQEEFVPILNAYEAEMHQVYLNYHDRDMISHQLDWKSEDLPENTANNMYIIQKFIHQVEYKQVYYSTPTHKMLLKEEYIQPKEKLNVQLNPLNPNHNENLSESDWKDLTRNAKFSLIDHGKYLEFAQYDKDVAVVAHLARSGYRSEHIWTMLDLDYDKDAHKYPMPIVTNLIMSGMEIVPNPTEKVAIELLKMWQVQDAIVAYNTGKVSSLSRYQQWG